MAGRPVSRNNIIAGLFVIASLILAVVISIVISGAQSALVRTTPYVVRFTLEEGAAGLQADSPVTLGGQSVGRVTGVDFKRSPGGEPEAVDVRIAVRADLTLYEDAWAFLERPLLGTLGTINIARPGDGSGVAAPQGTGPRLEAGEVLVGRIAPPAFLAQAGYGPEQSRQLQKILSDGAALMERISRVTARVEERLEPDLATVRGTLEDVRSVAADLRESMPEWTRRVDSVLERADNAAARLEPLMQSADETIGSARSIIEDNRDELDRIIANIDRAAERFSGGSLDQLEGALAAAQDGAEEFARTGRELSGLVRQERPNIERILANLRLAADQIKLTGIEVRRNPWRLLYTPTTKELDSELFYDAARTYAAAVSDLRAASEALEAAGREPPTPQSSEAVGRITAQLNDAFARYKTAEQGLLQQMIRRNTR